MTSFWSLCLAVALLCGPSGPPALSGLALENEVPLRPTSWLPEEKVTSVHLPKGRTRRFYFTLKKKTPSMSLTVSPCGVAIEWSLAARTLKDKPPKNPHWSSKKSMPEVWWRGPGTEAKIHSYVGNSVDTYAGPAYAPASLYILRLKSRELDTKASVFLHEGPGPSWAFPDLPTDRRVHMLGVGMTSVTLSWTPSPSVPQPGHSGKHSYDYCVLVNRNHNHNSACAAHEATDKEAPRKTEPKGKEKKGTVWPVPKDWWWQQWDVHEGRLSASDEFEGLDCACRGVESVCTVSELLPDTQYYFDVFVSDRVNGTSAAYTGAFARTHEEARPAVTTLKEGEPQQVRLQDEHNARQRGATFFSFRPRGWQQNGLLTLQSCNSTKKVKVSVLSKGKVLTSQEVGERLTQIWLQGSPSYLIKLENSDASAAARPKRSARSPTFLKIQASSAYHRQAAPVFPATLQLKSFNKLRTCDSVTLAWMGTEERSLYCVYSRRVSGGRPPADRCLGPESRPDSERILCKYFQELNPQRAVTTAVVTGLESGVAYMFDVYLIRRWGLPLKYHSKTVRTRKEC
ncbi:protein NDNF [Denticeps clupeoides]|uniref:Protein NDNF n=1 Tax=Denticeps clupeoides TaxID=299321 RepID=A0AAY4E6U9_9TELE|nr:protein NDNF-like [Denticeps clupeoides]XP_028845606.1 protein NDNF-like [Denticeps clupeoides]